MIRSEFKQDKKTFIALAIYAFVLMFFCSKMSPLYPFNEWSDINLYFNIGKAIANGQVLYTEAFDHKGPLIFFIYAIGYLISNTSFVGMYIIESIAWVFMIYAAYFTARLFVGKVYAFVVALVFPVLMLSHTCEGGSAEEFISICMVISMYFFIRYFKESHTVIHPPKFMLIHGVMLSIALFIKINLVVFWFFPLLAIFVCILYHKQYRNLIENVIAVLIGMLIIALPICLYLIVNKALGEAWNIYIVLNKSYAGVYKILETLEIMAVRFYLRLRFETFEFLLILVGAFYFPIKYLPNKWGKVAIPLSFIAVYCIIFITPQYVYYYSIPYYVFSLPACIVLCQFIRLNSNWKVYTICTVLALIWGIRQRNFFNIELMDLITRKEQPSLVNKFGKHISEEKDPVVLNLGLNLSNGLFTKLGLKPTLKYFITPNLSHEIYPVMRDTQTQYIVNREPQFILINDRDNNYEYFIHLPAFVDNYERIETFGGDPNTSTYFLYKRLD